MEDGHYDIKIVQITGSAKSTGNMSQSEVDTGGCAVADCLQCHENMQHFYMLRTDSMLNLTNPQIQQQKTLANTKMKNPIKLQDQCKMSSLTEI